MKLDRKTKGVFEVDFSPQSRRLRAQFFWPDQKPWPRSVRQDCFEGEVFDSYYVYVHQHHTSEVIFPGDLVLMEYGLDNIVGVLHKQQLDEEHYVVVQVDPKEQERMERLADKPASPLPWTLEDNVIYDANGESILGDDVGFNIGFPCEHDADYIYKAVKYYSERNKK